MAYNFGNKTNVNSTYKQFIPNYKLQLQKPKGKLQLQSIYQFSSYLLKE